MRKFIIVGFFMLFVSSAWANEEPILLFEKAENPVENIDVNPQKSLSENLEEKDGVKDPEDKTWLDQVIEAKSEKVSVEEDVVVPELEDKSSLKKMVEEKKLAGPKQTRSNASVFDISGVMLRMSVAQSEAALKKRGYKKLSQNMQIPNFIKWRNEEKCRNSGVVGYERLEACVAKLAKQKGNQYIESAKYEKKQTSENVEIFMTSNFTGNKVFRVIYSSQVPGITGNSEKSNYLRNIKIYEFWRKINHKYGRPDDEANVIWSMGENKPYLQAKTGFLVLEDKMLQELDWTRMSREDQKFLNTDLYTF